VAVPDAHLLLAVGRAGARIHIEHDGLGWVTDINNWLDEARADVQAFLAIWPRTTRARRENTSTTFPTLTNTLMVCSRPTPNRQRSQFPLGCKAGQARAEQ
jgi:hypothetical protein